MLLIYLFINLFIYIKKIENNILHFYLKTILKFLKFLKLFYHFIKIKKFFFKRKKKAIGKVEEKKKIFFLIIYSLKEINKKVIIIYKI